MVNLFSIKNRPINSPSAEITSEALSFSIDFKASGEGNLPKTPIQTSDTNKAKKNVPRKARPKTSLNQGILLFVFFFDFLFLFPPANLSDFRFL